MNTELADNPIQTNDLSALDPAPSHSPVINDLSRQEPQALTTTRLRLTPTRMRALQSSLTSSINSLERTYDHIEAMLDGRENDDSPATLALRELRGSISAGDFSRAQEISKSLVATFNAFV